MKKILFGLLAIGLVVCFSAFGPNKKSSDEVTGFLYKYTGPSNPDITDIQTRTNYQRFDGGCGDGEHVCGVYLPTNSISGGNPDPDEFDEVKDELWNSEFGQSATLPEIVMKD